jgi:hypothetical protein
MVSRRSRSRAMRCACVRRGDRVDRDTTTGVVAAREATTASGGAAQ